MLYHHLAASLDQVMVVCERYPIQRLSFFGSVLRDDFNADSDVDVLVEFLPGAKITYLDMVALQDELAVLFEREVDLLTPGALSRYFRQKVLDTARVFYERK
jgi:hypothetical protein